MIDQSNQKILFVGGKGGVGKSTSASALALAYSKSGKRTLLVSTDPAHNLGDIFHQPLGHRKIEISRNLWCLEINADKESVKYIATVKENLKGLVKAKMIDEVNRQIDLASTAPGADEAALFDRVISIILEENDSFDKIIFDTAPTGHTIRLLSLPELMSVWIDGMIEKRKRVNQNYSQLLNDGEPIEDPIYTILQNRKEKFARVRNILLDTEKTSFIFVLTPERLPILETRKAIKQLEKHGLFVGMLIVNKVLPDYADGEFLRKRKLQEINYLFSIKKSFSKQKIIKIPMFEEDVYNIERLNTFSEYLSTRRVTLG